MLAQPIGLVFLLSAVARERQRCGELPGAGHGTAESRRHHRGRSAAEAFFRTYYLRQACSVQVKVLSMGVEPYVVDPQAVARFQDQMAESPHYFYDGSTEWAALLRKLDREQPDYKS